ncbi:MAG TPA: impB/mucB/samB family protein [Alphaproteobacteria bacterium]|nr:impB/mucB/samB family protein [Alphaproteobacteria bacterium]
MQAPFFTPDQNPYQWLFLDLNSYFASVEQQENPKLRGKPVAVVPLLSDATCAIAASYEAKKYGIKTGTKIYEAKKLCPDLICALAHHGKYVEYHHRILGEVIKHTPINKICSIDELSSRLPPNKRSNAAAAALAHRIKTGIRQNIGEAITCSIGIAPNAFLAKIATDMMKPDGLVLLDHDSFPSRLFKLRLTDLPGINVRMGSRLHKGGIRSIEQFWNLSPKHARAVWGSVEGERFWYKLHGYDLPDLPTEHSVVGHSRVLDPDLRTPAAAKLVARRLTVKAASRLRRMDLYASDFSFSFRDQNNQRYGATLPCPPSQDNFTFLEALKSLWTIMMAEIHPTKLKKVSVSLHGLCERTDITPDLFDIGADKTLHEKNSKISDMIDAINRKFGAEAIHLGPSPKTSAGYVGTKIAFNRIPDLEEFHE